jgi:two-component system, OmpR family, response regulator MprA
MAEQRRILVVDDDERIAASVRRALIYEGYEVEVAADAEQVFSLTRQARPDLIVLDVMLPGLDGLEVCRRLRAADDVPILMLTARDATVDRVRGLDSGADDYLVKPFAYEELLARVRALLRRHGSANELRFADLRMDVEAHEVRRADGEVELTAQEFRLLEHFLRHPRAVLSREALLSAVWDMPSDVESNVVDVYVGYLRQKLGEPRLLHTVRGVGYVLK